MSKLDDIFDIMRAHGGSKKAKVQIKDLILELIGKDDNIGIDPGWGKERHRDELRAELRKKVEEL